MLFYYHLYSIIVFKAYKHKKLSAYFDFQINAVNIQDNQPGLFQLSFEKINTKTFNTVDPMLSYFSIAEFASIDLTDPKPFFNCTILLTSEQGSSKKKNRALAGCT